MTGAGSPPPKILYPEWQHEFEAALLELEPGTLRERVRAAENTIFNRARVLLQDADANAERQAVADALARLRVLTSDIPRNG
jgi:hypothetical protein